MADNYSIILGKTEPIKYISIVNPSVIYDESDQHIELINVTDNDIDFVWTCTDESVAVLFGDNSDYYIKPISSGNVTIYLHYFNTLSNKHHLISKSVNILIDESN